MESIYLQRTIFITLIILLSIKIIRSVFFAEKVVRDNAYGKQFLSPINSVILTLCTALTYVGGFIYAELSYFWLFASVLTFFSAFVVYGQAKMHSEQQGMDTEISLALQPEELAAEIKSKKKQFIGPLLIIIVWVFAWRNVLFNT